MWVQVIFKNKGCQCTIWNLSVGQYNFSFPKSIQFEIFNTNPSQTHLKNFKLLLEELNWAEKPIIDNGMDYLFHSRCHDSGKIYYSHLCILLLKELIILIDSINTWCGMLSRSIQIHTQSHSILSMTQHTCINKFNRKKLICKCYQ